MIKPLVLAEQGVPPTFLQLNRLLKALPAPLPADYEEFLKKYNGGVPRVAPLVIPFLEIQDRVVRFRGIRSEDDPFALRPNELVDEVPDSMSLLLIADTKRNNPLALCLSRNDYGAVYYVLRNPGQLTSGTFALQRCWRLFENFTELCGNLMRPATKEIASTREIFLDFATGDETNNHITGLWTRHKE